MPAIQMINSRHASRLTHHEWPEFLRFPRFLVFPILLAAVFFRFHALDQIPPGLTHDEAAVGFFARQIANGAPFAIDAPYGYANEPFTKYAAALVMRWVGQSDWALRAHQAFWGVMLVLFTFLWGRAAFGRAAGLGGAALVAVSFWPQMSSRFALNNSPAPALFTAAMWLMWVGLFSGRAVPTARTAAWIGFALCLSGSLITYEAARGAWLSLPIFFLYLLLFGPRRRLVQFAVALLAGTGLALPHLLNPAAWGRTGTLAGPLTAAVGGDLRPLIGNSLEALGALFVKGDPFITYNIPGRPVLDPFTAALFVGGALYCLWHWRKPACAFVLLWFGAAFAPAMAVGAFNMTMHAVAAQGVVFLLPALAVEALAHHREHREHGDRKRSFILRVLRGKTLWIGFAVLVGATAIITYRDYFDRWANSAETRAAYFSGLRGVTAFLRDTSFQGLVTLSSPFPDLPHDPFIADLRVRRDDLDLRWFDARAAFVFPQAEQSLLVVPANAYPDPIFAAHLPLADAGRHIVRESDVDPYFDTLIWNPQKVLDAWLADGSLTVANPPVNFGGAVELVAFKSPAAARIGESASTITFWRVADPAALGPRSPINYAPEAALFLHVLDANGNLITGDDRLQAPAWNWRAGDVFAQIHRAAILQGAAPGEYRLEVGVYTLPDIIRLPRTDGGDAVAIGTMWVAPP